MSWIFGRRSFGQSRQSVLPMRPFERCHHPLLTFIVDSFICRGFPKIATDTLHSQLSLNQIMSMFSLREGERTMTRWNMGQQRRTFMMHSFIIKQTAWQVPNKATILVFQIWHCCHRSSLASSHEDTRSLYNGWIPTLDPGKQTGVWYTCCTCDNDKNTAGRSDGDRLTPYNRNRFIDLF